MRMRPFYPLLALTLLALLAIVVFMTINAHGRWSFILPFRGVKLATLVLVGYAVAVSTVLFQTISHNRILTPAIMGFDSLYILIQTVIVFFFGAAGASSIGPAIMFVVEVAALTFFACVLYRWLLSYESGGLHLLLLTGIIFGLFFRSLSGLLQRMIDPADFVVLQDRFFASFNVTDTSLLGISALAIAAVSFVGWRMFRYYDVLALGRETAVSLGVDYTRCVTIILILVTVLVAVSTALVGPITFLGLIVANMAYHISSSYRHSVILPVAVLLTVISLVGGQVLLERVFAFNTALSIIIEFIGGLFFIILLIRGAAR